MSGRWVVIERAKFPENRRKPWAWSTVAASGGFLVQPGHARTMVGARFAAWWASWTADPVGGDE